MQQRQSPAAERTTVYLDKPYVLLQWDPANQWVEIEWKGYSAGDEYRAALNEELSALIRHGAARLLCDLRRMTVMTADDQAWVDAEFMPRMINMTRLKHVAIVLPQTALANMSLKRIINKTSPAISREVESAYFGDPEQAKEWLRSL